MTLDYVLSDGLEETFNKLAKKDPVLAAAVGKKINQITCLLMEEVQHFKNLRGDLREYKRVHVGSHILMFKIHGNLLVFDRFTHHDKAYG